MGMRTVRIRLIVELIGLVKVKIRWLRFCLVKQLKRQHYCDPAHVLGDQVWCLSVARTLIESTVKIEVEMFANHEQMEALVAEHTMRPSLESKQLNSDFLDRCSSLGELVDGEGNGVTVIPSLWSSKYVEAIEEGREYKYDAKAKDVELQESLAKAKTLEHIDASVMGAIRDSFEERNPIAIVLVGELHEDTMFS
ncbi:hypothetical protein V6N13_033790 [Hibiscus sabdariffa]